MQTIRGLPVGAFLLLTAAVWSETAAEDGKLILGTWVPTAVELAGQKMSEETLKIVSLHLKDGKYMTKFGDRTDSGTIKLDPSKTPKAMDITGTDGPNKGKTFLAIYELTGDRLVICYDLSGKSRPAEFKTKPDTLLFLATYQREKP